MNTNDRVEVEYFIALLSMSPPLPQLADVKPSEELCAKLRGIYQNFGEADAVWVKTTEFKGGAEGEGICVLCLAAAQALSGGLPLARVCVCVQECMWRDGCARVGLVDWRGGAREGGEQAKQRASNRPPTDSNPRPLLLDCLPRYQGQVAALHPFYPRPTSLSRAGPHPHARGMYLVDAATCRACCVVYGGIYGPHSRPSRVCGVWRYAGCDQPLTVKD